MAEHLGRAYRGAAIDVTSAFANEAGLTPEKRLLFTAINLVVVVAYTLFLWKTLPEKHGPGPFLDGVRTS